MPEPSAIPPAPRHDSGLRPSALTFLAPALTLAVCAWIGSVLLGGFSFDDREAIFENPYVVGHLPWSDALARDYWAHRGAAGHWRPAALVSLRLDHALYGAWAPGYHLTNLLLHLLVLTAAGLCARALARDARENRLLQLGLFVFALHPALADSVAWISGRTSMLSALGPLAAAAWLVSARRRPLPTTLITALGLFCGLAGKEDAVVLAPLLLVFAAGYGPGQSISGESISSRARWRGALAAALGVTVVVGLALLLRHAALGSPGLVAPGSPLAADTLGERALLGGRAWLEALLLVASPVLHPPHYSAPAWRTPAGQLAGALGLGFLAVAACLISAVCARRALRGQRALLAGSACATLVAALPMTQLVPLGEPFAPRFLYLPLCMAIPLLGALLAMFASALSRLSSAAPSIALALALPAVLALAWVRSAVYASSESFWLAVLEARPDDSRAWNALGLVHQDADQLELARRAFEHAHALDPAYSRPLSNLGQLAVTQGRNEEALLWLQRAVHEGPRNPIAHVNLGSALLRLERPAEARRAYARAVELAPQLLAAQRGLARSALDDGDLPAAAQALECALALDPRDPRTRALRERLEAAAAPVR